jgi:hypothetical protein
MMRKSKHAGVSLTAGWSEALLKAIVGYVNSGKRDNYFTVFKFKIDGFLQKVDEDGYELKGLRYAEIERKAYGSIQIEIRDSELILPVFVTFRVKQENEEFPSELGKEIDAEYVKPYYIGWCHFNEYYVDSSSRVPSLDFVIWLLPEEWESVKESLLFAKSPPVMSVQVEFPSKPDPSTLVPENLKEGLYVLHFRVRGVLAFDSKALLENPVFKFNYDL